MGKKIYWTGPLSVGNDECGLRSRTDFIYTTLLLSILFPKSSILFLRVNIGWQAIIKNQFRSQFKMACESDGIAELFYDRNKMYQRSPEHIHNDHMCCFFLALCRMWIKWRRRCIVGLLRQKTIVIYWPKKYTNKGHFNERRNKD